MNDQAPIPFSVVMPAYNESDRISKTLTRLQSWTPRFFNPIEIIVVDDGSQDSTIQVVEKFMKDDPRLRLIKAAHGGAMHALITGYKEARYDTIGNMEADMATDPAEFERLLPLLEKADIVTGSRQLRGDLPPIEGKSFFRRALSMGLSRMFLALFTCGVRDPQIGFRIFKKKALYDALPLLTSSHDGIKCAELLIKAHGLGFSIKEVPVLYTHDEASRLVPKRPYRVVLRVFTALIRVWVNSAKQFREGVLKRQPVRGFFLLKTMGRL